MRRRLPKSGQRSLRDVSAELARLGHLNTAGRPFSASSIKNQWLKISAVGPDKSNPHRGLLDICLFKLKISSPIQERDTAYHAPQCRDTAYHAPRHVGGDLKQIVASTPCSIEPVPMNSDDGPPGFSQKVVRATKRISLKPLRTPPFDRLPLQQVVRSQMEMLVE